MPADQQQQPPQNPPPVDPQTIQERLLTREGGGIVSRGSLLKCTHRYRDLMALILRAADAGTPLTPEQANEIEVAKAALQRELRLHGLEMRKIGLVAQAAQAELEQYEAASRQIDTDVASTRAEIEQLKIELAHERQVRKNREEYESLAKMANVRPARRETESKLAAVQEEMERIRKDEAEGVEELRVRAKQFHLLMQAVNDLKANIAEDEVKKKALEEAAAGDDDIAMEEGEATEEALADGDEETATGTTGIVEQMDTTL
mmetsp:Transcript_3619/g.8228  ORF Transcript_3619/g.8228 Transcript_3619/m.8228 type:complete len:261 (+) Transcript_3619:47-829(+)